MREIVAGRISRGATYIARRNGPVAEIVGALTLEWADDGVWSDGAANVACWVVLLALYFLSPLMAEILSGSTPPLLFIQPFGLIFVPLLYGPVPS